MPGKVVLISTLGWFSVLAAVPQQSNPPTEIVVEPSALTLEVGQKATLTAVVKDADGQTLDLPVVFFSRARRSVGVNASGHVEAYRPGDYVVVALVPKDPGDAPRRAEAVVQTEIKVTIPNPPIASVKFKNVPSRFYAGTTVPLHVEIIDQAGFKRPAEQPQYQVSSSEIAQINRFGHLSLLQPGRVEVEVVVESARDTLAVDAQPTPVASFQLKAGADEARTGDVIQFQVVARDKAGGEVVDLPVQYSVSGKTEASIIGAGATAQITDDGRFVAERSGIYTVVAVAGFHSDRYTVEIKPRNVGRKVEVVGHGAVRDRHTSDFWVWEGTDGKDYAVTGTWGADGHAYIWDVTDPQHMSLVDVVRVDARTVNDVKVSEDGRIAVISREGASSRKNGFVVLDVSDVQSGVKILSSYSDQLTGGVHNVFVYQDHVYALSAGRRYDIISIKDPRNPQRVGRFELDEPGHGIHDVWVEDGIAYSSNWAHGIVAVDIGGKHGGSPSDPVKLGSYAYPSGWNHAAFPYRSKSTGKFYVFGGDEAFPYESVTESTGVPQRAAGWIHVVEWDQWEHPREVARYQVPESGSHNFWIEDDILYIGYYNGGLRVVDVSGELLGDLYKQGREIAFWMPYDAEGFTRNAPFSWGAQPHKGNIFLSDYNSGLWCVRLGEPEELKRRGRWRFGEIH